MDFVILKYNPDISKTCKEKVEFEMNNGIKHKESLAPRVLFLHPTKSPQLKTWFVLKTKSFKACLKIRETLFIHMVHR